MKSWLYMTAFFLVVLLVGGAVFYYAKSINDITYETINPVEKKSDNIVISEKWWTYKNEKYGFTMKLPGNNEKWVIEEKEYIKENCPLCLRRFSTIYFNYKLDEPLNNGSLKDMGLWYIEIIPLGEYSDDLCAGFDGSCRHGEILARTNEYVFLAGFTNIEGAGSACVDYPIKLKEFCEVDKYFGLDNINSLVDFKIAVNSN